MLNKCRNSMNDIRDEYHTLLVELVILKLETKDISPGTVGGMKSRYFLPRSADRRQDTGCPTEFI